MNTVKNRVGERYFTKEGYWLEIIEYFSSINSTVRFEDGTVIYNKKFWSIIKGTIEHPLRRRVYGVGFRGIGKYSRKTNPQAHITWRNILCRCYDDQNRTIKNTVYDRCSVDERWHNFQVFAEWYEENYKPHMKGWHLDKDLIIKGNKVYSPEACDFVPLEINLILGSSGKSRGDYIIGVHREGDKFRALCTINKDQKDLGLYDTPIEGFNVYKEAKEKEMKRVAKEWSEKISEKMYNTLINYKIEITD